MLNKALSCSLALCLLAARAAAQEPGPDSERRKPPRQDLTEMNLEELMNLDVTSVSKNEQSLRGAPAAVTVILGDDLRRTGVTSIPEALRLVPGLFVSRLDANEWVISSRGFANIYANKLLVLIDGRSVYTPLFSGVFWTIQDVMLQDVDRIEVIRGPGATVWGANAVNGVINVITKPASKTQGALVAAGGGTQERAFADARYGGKVGENLYYRAYAKYFNRDSFEGGNDAWQGRRGGFRTDSAVSTADQLTVQGDVYEATADTLLTQPLLAAPFATTGRRTTRYSGGNLLSRWEHDYGDGSKLRAQAYWDRTILDGPLVGETRDTGDFDVQHRFGFLWGQQLTWGLGYRITSTNTDNTFSVSIFPDHQTDTTTSAFLQDEIPLLDNLTLVIGSKFEVNSYTGFEFEPGIRVSWTPHERHGVWASVARAVRTPSQAEADAIINLQVFPNAPPTVVRAVGSDDFRSEDLLACEAGYRVLPLDDVSLDIATYYNSYTHLRTTDKIALDSSDPAFVAQPLEFQNNMRGATWGVEVLAAWQLLADLRLQTGYSFFRMSLEPSSGSTEGDATDPEREYPRHMAFARTSIDVVKEVQVDVIGRYVSSLEAQDVSDYFQVDARIGWKLRPNMEAALVGQSLTAKSHLEQDTTVLGAHAARVQRGVYASLTWRF